MRQAVSTENPTEAHSLSTRCNLWRHVGLCGNVESQNDIGEGESVTDGFKMLNLSAKKSFNLNGEGDLTVSVFANNLLDEVARNHSSFVKNEVPLAGRNLGLKIRAVF